MNSTNQLGQLKGKRILITGGAGYLGSYVTKQLVAHGANVIVYSRDELKHFDLNLQLQASAQLVKFVIGDVRDRERLISASKQVDIVIHAAALKQVGVCEKNPEECFKTNVAGTENVIAACKQNDVSKLLFISTDKAVEPVSVYGNSKQAGEKLVLNANDKELQSTVLRFGNLIGSPGSIVDKVNKIGALSELTIYSEELTRFQDSVETAYDLICKQLAGNFGGVIMLPILSSIRVHELIRENFPNVLISFGGQCDFEKTHEKLATAAELQRSVVNKDYILILPESLDTDQSLDQYGCLPTELTSYSSADVLSATTSNRDRKVDSRLETE